MWTESIWPGTSNGVYRGVYLARFSFYKAKRVNISATLKLPKYGHFEIKEAWKEWGHVKLLTGVPDF